MLAEKLQEEVLKLNPSDKIHLAEMLLVSLDKPDTEIENIWVEESERRYEAYKNGKIQGIPLDQIIQRIKK